jgi:hypothetical protein
MAAIAWSWAAKEYLEIADDIVFHSGGYKGWSQNLINNYKDSNNKTIMGVPILQWIGMTLENKPEHTDKEEVFPKMKRWLRVAV